jgi:transcription initiation factor TFIIIB Brf1 subunit/transcription initiation factor TFIIB
MLGTHTDITDKKNREQKIEKQLEELRRWHDAMLGREERISELKQEVNDLLAKLGEPSRYRSVEHEGDIRD